MPYYDVANLVTVTKTKCLVVMEPYEPLLQKYGTKSPAELRRGLSCFKISLSYKSNIRASRMHLFNCKCFEKHLRMLLQSLKSLCLAPGGPGSIWKYLYALVTSRGVSGRLACGFRTDIHLADALVRHRALSNSLQSQ
jgi:hypothetical protein